MISSTTKTHPASKGLHSDWSPGIVGTYEPAFDDGRFWSQTFVGAQRGDIPGMDADFMPIMNRVINMPDLNKAAEVITAIAQLQTEVRKLRSGEEADLKTVDHCLGVLSAGGPQLAFATEQTAQLVRSVAGEKGKNDIAAAADKALAALPA